MAGGGQLRDAEDPARRVVRLVRPGVTYIDGGELKGGGRSLGNLGVALQSTEGGVVGVYGFMRSC